MVLKDGKVAGFISLWAFRFHYSTMYEKCKMAFAVTVFVVSFIMLWCDVFTFVSHSGLSSAKVFVSMIVMLASGYSIYRDLKSVIYAFVSDKELVRYAKRTDGKLREINNLVSHVLGCAFESNSNAVRIECPEIHDFIYFYPNISDVLLAGGWFSAEEVAEQNTKRWHKIHNDLHYALELIQLRKAATSYKNFFNEDKISLVKDPTLRSNSEVRLTISRSCYYATYITTESYRDVIYEDGRQVDFVDWCPYILDDKGNHRLPSFDCKSSLQMGVNTLAITSDGYILLWMQGVGARSENLAAPSGSGSMDWNDYTAVRHLTRNKDVFKFDDVIRCAAHREFVQETFSKESANKVPDIQMDTRIIGMFRWGSLGGLPGFLCVTKLNADLDYVLEIHRIKLSEGRRCKELLNLKIKGDSDAILENIRSFICNRKDNIPMSLPLRAAFEALKYAVETSSEFCQWINSGM